MTAPPPDAVRAGTASLSRVHDGRLCHQLLAGLFDPVTTPTEFPAADGLLVVALIAAVLLTVVSLRIALLAVQIRGRGTSQQHSLWEYYIIAGTIAAIYGGLTAVGIVGGQRLIVLDGLLLGVVVAVALTMRAAYDTTSGGGPASATQLRLRRGVELIFVLFVVAAAFGPAVDADLATLLTAIAAVLAVGYGLTYQRRRVLESATRGTLVDSLLRLTVPVLVFAAGALVVGAVELAGVAIDASVTMALESVFVLLTASAMLSVTTKLGSHLRGL